MEHVLEIKDLSITLNDNAILKNIDMHVDAGEIVGFIGDNGSGKSTTMKAIANLVFPAPDTISISGFDVRRHSTEALKSLSAVIEEPVFFENLSGADNLSIMANLRHTPLEDVMVFIHDYQMEAHLKRKVRRYSQGMRKRLALCLALAVDADLFILDEPFSGLDQRGMRTLMNHLDDLRKKKKAVIVSSHQLAELSRVMDRPIYIEDGRIVDHIDYSF